MFGVIHSKWKKFLSESAKGIDDIISSKFHVSIRNKTRAVGQGQHTSVDISLWADQEEETRVAQIEIRQAKVSLDGQCLSCYVVDWSETTERGYGPLLYDLALEYAGSAGLAADRRAVSNDAESVWAHYLNKRSDVSWKQLDDEFSTLTPDTADDCVQVSPRRRSPEKGPKDLAWVNSPLSKVYYKKDKPFFRLLQKYKLVSVET
jgi:hypothetical protein